MPDHFLNAEDIRGLFLILDDCEQNALAIINSYTEKLRQKGYGVQIVNPSRPDVLESIPIPPRFWPPSVNLAQPLTVLILHSIELLQTLADVDFQTIFKQLIVWLALENVSQVIVSVNRDLRSSEELQKLEYLCSQKLDIIERNGSEFKVETVWKKPRGKAVVQKELVVIEGSQIVQCSVLKDPVIAENPKTQPTNLLSDLTFNVNISGEERKDKENLVLPYTEAGQITYTLDREDDFDEEDDPDDDLEI